MTRRSDGREFVAPWIDGKTLRKQQILPAGLNTERKQLILGFAEVKTETHKCVVALLQDIQIRGFHSAGHSWYCLMVPRDCTKTFRMC